MEGSNEELNPNAMTAEQTAALFSKLRRRRVPVAEIEADIEDGAPTNGSDRLNLLTYTAWMLKETGRGE
ncbi:hypothetical protein FHS27_001356 [Rhodopirellula rubra]|uniref:Uncharacterized protein n=1 Tax=Aporhodopirellula rubra TaxID=980271 RepID=A0A7W5DW33_9BACT|nr:hypothetical protein [Aporhodopirellula rubra]MBB3205556.1 hypothetical protein [Aporhodopirellula rubra]